MNDALAFAIFMQSMLLSVLIGVILYSLYKIKRIFHRALTFVFTVSFRPKWKKL